MTDIFRKPDFFIVGAPKCGTTSFYEYLSAHPRIFLPFRDDLHFFAKDFSEEWDQVRNLNEYMWHFRKAGSRHLAVGERSIFYLFSGVAMQRLAEFNSGARLIVMLRNPVDMAQSFHSQILFTLNEDVDDFEEAWRLQEARRRGEHIPPTCRDPRVLQYAEVCRLGRQVQRMLSSFPRGQVKFVFLEDVAENVHGIYRELLRFLGVPYDGRTRFPRRNERKALRSRRLARLVLRQPPLLRALTGGIKRLLRIQQTGIGVALMRVNTRNIRPQPLSPGFKRELVNTFREDVKLLSSLTGRDLRHWLE
jgi:hypothetical protein